MCFSPPALPSKQLSCEVEQVCPASSPEVVRLEELCDASFLPFDVKVSLLTSITMVTELINHEIVFRDIVDDLRALSLIPPIDDNATQLSQFPHSKYFRTTRIDLSSSSERFVDPICSQGEGFPFIIQTLDASFVLVMANPYDAWLWLSLLRKACSRVQRKYYATSFMNERIPPVELIIDGESCPVRCSFVDNVIRFYGIDGSDTNDAKSSFSLFESVINVKKIVSIVFACDFMLPGSSQLFISLDSETTSESGKDCLPIILKAQLHGSKCCSLVSSTPRNASLHADHIILSLHSETPDVCHGHDGDRIMIRTRTASGGSGDNIFICERFLPISDLLPTTADKLSEEMAVVDVNRRYIYSVHLLNGEQILYPQCTRPAPDVLVLCSFARRDGTSLDSRANKVRPLMKSLKYETWRLALDAAFSLEVNDVSFDSDFEYFRIDLVHESTNSTLGRLFLPLSDFRAEEWEMAYEVSAYDVRSYSHRDALRLAEGRVTARICRREVVIVDNLISKVSVRSKLSAMRVCSNNGRNEPDASDSWWPAETVSNDRIGTLDDDMLVEKVHVKLVCGGIFLRLLSAFESRQDPHPEKGGISRNSPSQEAVSGQDDCAGAVLGSNEETTDEKDYSKLILRNKDGMIPESRDFINGDHDLLNKTNASEQNSAAAHIDDTSLPASLAPLKDEEHTEYRQSYGARRRQQISDRKLGCGLLSECKERTDVTSDEIFIPWLQIMSATTLTRALIHVRLQVHAVSESTSNDESCEIRIVDLFIQNCPAESLFHLISNRIATLAQRDLVTELLTKTAGKRDASAGNLFRSGIADIFLLATEFGDKFDVIDSRRFPWWSFLTRSNHISLCALASARLRCYAAALLSLMDIINFDSDDGASSPPRMGYSEELNNCQIFERDEVNSSLSRSSTYANYHLPALSPYVLHHLPSSDALLLTANEERNRILAEFRGLIICFLANFELRGYRKPPVIVQAMVNEYFGSICSCVGKVYDQTSELLRVNVRTRNVFLFVL